MIKQTFVGRINQHTMATIILVAGATGDLGGRINRALLDRGASVWALVRPGTDPAKLATLEQQGIIVVRADLADVAQLTKACEGVSCLVSALQGLHDVIVDTQSRLLEAAVAAGVSRFIPSDFASDFTKLPAGVNRNFDLRREFKTILDQAAIAPTSILNGAFAEIVSHDIPLLDTKKRTVGYWDDPDWRIDFTTMDNTAAFTAAAAMDESTPRLLRIASFQISPNELVRLTGELTGEPFTLVRMGSREEFAAYNQRERVAHPEGETELYPAWQQGQYLYSMFSVQNDPLDTGRYPDIQWTPARDVLAARLNRSEK